ncbi:ParB N-terminal domain-containing protein [Nocardioides rotundus]|uniref:ParB N-terminal domain-containing protein n=1 Tax=Nocardioides rotundus TaxID=1774216 RepID=UPI001CC03691|nr:ParB N-terminal domain-containing protein [Nocardioides rotundus]UAL30418.1 ParB N-terminal domain-containing protein [Nocardioides rotundus]
MSAQKGSIELERTVESIHVGRRHRTDLGDIDALAASIARDGLLQPITITLDNVLVCGARRLAAIKQLGWRTVNVWVRSGISDRLGHLLAEQDENVLHKPLTQLEAAALYRELKQLMAEDAARRQAATQFTTEHQPGGDGAGKFPTPSEQAGRASEQAARMIPGAASYKTLDKIGYLQQIADDPARPGELRQQATAALERIDAGASVDPLFQHLRDQVDTALGEREADLHRLAAEALSRVKKTQKKKRTSRPTDRAGDGAGEPVRYPPHRFVLTWNDLIDWWSYYDVDQLAVELTDEQIDAFLATVEGTSRFAQQLRTARDRLRGDDPAPGRGHLRAL